MLEHSTAATQPAQDDGVRPIERTAESVDYPTTISADAAGQVALLRQLPPAQIVALQRLVGNAAVAFSLTGRPACRQGMLSPTVQRQDPPPAGGGTTPSPDQSEEKHYTLTRQEGRRRA